MDDTCIESFCGGVLSRVVLGWSAWKIIRPLVVFLAILLSGCGSHIYHIVEPGETLYSIGWIYGYDYNEIAEWNHIRTPYTISLGQRLRVAPLQHGNSSKTSLRTQRKSAGVQAKTSKQSEPQKTIVWKWPTQGKIIKNFSSGRSKKNGIDIAGKLRQPVYAAAEGRVVYSGHGIVGYGELVIIKHNQTYLSAYAHNNKVLVKEGDVVKLGQMIAKMGSTGTNGNKLHFQIRRYGKPVNPIKYLP
jgi:lipoprotein NlpD